MTGNYEDAAIALSDPQEYLFSDFGTTRIVYLINGVIYKVNIDSSFDCNEYEIEGANIIKGKLPTGVRIPEMTLYHVDGETVLAMEYVTGISTGSCLDIFLGLDCSCDEKGCLDPILLDELVAAGWNDTSYSNAVWEDDNTLCLIDLA